MKPLILASLVFAADGVALNPLKTLRISVSSARNSVPRIAQFPEEEGIERFVTPRRRLRSLGSLLNRVFSRQRSWFTGRKINVLPHVLGTGTQQHNVFSLSVGGVVHVDTEDGTQDLKVSFDDMGLFANVDVSYDQTSGVLAIHGDDGKTGSADEFEAPTKVTRCVTMLGVSKPEMISAETTLDGRVLVTVPHEAVAPLAKKKPEQKKLDVRVVSEGQDENNGHKLIACESETLEMERTATTSFAHTGRLENDEYEEKPAFAGFEMMSKKSSEHTAEGSIDKKDRNAGAKDFPSYVERARELKTQKLSRISHRVSEKMHEDFNNFYGRVLEGAMGRGKQPTKGEVLEAIVEHFLAKNDPTAKE